jgi:hypothetical protein
MMDEAHAACLANIAAATSAAGSRLEAGRMLREMLVGIRRYIQHVHYFPYVAGSHAVFSLDSTISIQRSLVN